MNKFFHIYLEPLEERYTEQWFRWFRDADYGTYRYIPIGGEALCDKIKVGAFLDVNSTIHWKAEQVKQVAALFHNNHVKDGDIFFVADMWFPVELLKYLIQLNGIDAKVYAFLHAGTYTTEDFAAPMANWAKHVEVGWATALDGIFVGSQYHKEAFLNRRLIAAGLPWQSISDKIHVTGNPFNSAEVRLKGLYPSTKENLIIFPNRFDYEKRPNDFLNIATILKDRYPDWAFAICTSRNSMRSSHSWLTDLLYALNKHKIVQYNYDMTKEQYYQMLSRAKVMVSTTIEENFGYCTLEAMALDTIPVVPNRFSHPEIVGQGTCLYEDINDALVKIESAMEASLVNNRYGEQLEVYDRAVQRIVNICRGVLL